MMHPATFNTAQVCKQFGAANAVMSPGSRNAPLTISFARHPDIQKWIIPDERAAAFIALGIAQETNSPVVLCCTSGSALLNYAPAIAEAYYREIPLVVLSADRPPELIDQRDGQTIRQFGALENHVLGSFQLPIIESRTDEKEYESTLIEGLKKASGSRKGPVHINIPFREPFYPISDQKLSYHPINSSNTDSELRPSLDIETLDLVEFKRVLIIVGQHPPDRELTNFIAQASAKVPVLKFPLNNLATGINHVDGFIDNQQDLKPDLLLTTGLSVLSKKLKNYLRRNKPQKHIHFDPAGVTVDTYNTEPKLISQDIYQVLANEDFNSCDQDYLSNWKKNERRAKNIISDYLDSSEFSEASVAAHILGAIPAGSTLHLSNSMPVRYADLFGIKKGVKNESNRGTSGIDGCTSTAVGSSLVSNNLNVL
ncbi:MAG: 2-succinyl-5-enolpyruvyl-6-hydroxy-3-cyclohexene-1-carboxylic-acid synthase, partial [Ekhidna sp.]|nr:2-succinyl-5-enolpyruvyl-6-hydroxy-3-cyclohexene-1-carboxylic-acid synthase [Ekhidna sp.]